MTSKAPISKETRAQLALYAKDVKAAAAAKELTLDHSEFLQESSMAQRFFELGCWLHYYSNKVGVDGPQGLKWRIECLEKIFTNSFSCLKYEFFTVFDFGERQFDTIMEMGDCELIQEALRAKLDGDDENTAAHIRCAFGDLGWSLERNESAAVLLHQQMELLRLSDTSKPQTLALF